MSSGRQVRLHRVMVITDDREWAGVRSEQLELEDVGVLPPTEFAAADLVLVIGPIQNAERALELAGSVRLALERGATFVFLYSGNFANVDWRFISDLVPELAGGSVSGSVRAAATDPAPHPAFRSYMMLHGQPDLQFSSLPDGAEVLAYALVSLQPQRQVLPTAVRIGFADGSLYILPYQPPSSCQLMLERLAKAVVEHREGWLPFPPSSRSFGFPMRRRSYRALWPRGASLSDLRTSVQLSPSTST